MQILFKKVHDIHQGIRACLHGGGGPPIGEVTCGGSPHLTCKRDQVKMRDYMDRRVTSPKRVTSPTWGPPPPCKQALNFLAYSRISYAHFQSLRNSASSCKANSSAFFACLEMRWLFYVGPIYQRIDCILPTFSKNRKRRLVMKK